MKTPEDEAFDDLARNQGAWGGGFPAKRAMAADKLQECPNLKNCEGACFQCAYFNAETGKTEYPVAQPAQEPVAWALEWTFDGEEKGRRLYDDERHCKLDAENDGGICRPLVYGYTAPPKREWVGLTDGEAGECHSPNYVQTVARIEAKLKEKNA